MPSSSPSGTLPSTLSAVEVTALADRYAKPASRTATRTNTPSLLTAQSIQIVPRALIDDQAALALTDAVRNVSGVQYDFGFNGAMEITVLGITGPGSVPRQPDRRQAVAPMPARVAT
ncbi:TonB-dependent receptor plug domain-containing protein [Xanthomonas arboricola]|uniref:TonB-dependent receptor plug domain-containing protein n=1 Tax=Xanthomonas arboricola TaxID=56448 RepID=UPI003CCEE4A1